jgi:hypothetical protein
MNTQRPAENCRLSTCLSCEKSDAPKHPDTERLDWLEMEARRWPHRGIKIQLGTEPLRETIDKAMKASTPEAG